MGERRNLTILGLKEVWHPLHNVPGKIFLFPLYWRTIYESFVDIIRLSFMTMLV